MITRRRSILTLCLVGLVALALVVVFRLNRDEARAADEVWIMTSMAVDGEVIELGHRPVFLVTNDGRVVARDDRCDALARRADGSLVSTVATCSPDRGPNEIALGGPVDELGDVLVERDLLTLSSNGMRLEYERFDDPAPAELFAVLAEEGSAESAEIVLDPAYRGTPDFNAVAALATVDGIDYFVAVDGGVVCFVRSTGETGSNRCSHTREAGLVFDAAGLWVAEGNLGPPAALIPDAFVDAAASAGLGPTFGNLLIVDSPITVGDTALEVDLVNDDGEVFRLFVGR